MTMSSSQSMPSGVEKESDSTEEEKGKPISGTNAKNSRNGRGSRIKRAKSGKSFSNQQSTTMRSNNNKNKMNDSNEDESNNGSNDLSEETANSSQSASEKCIVHCVLEQLSMTDDNGFPDHSKIINELMKDNPKREVKNFLQDTTDECFQEVDEANESDSCEYSNKLIICLAEKGKSNCADWPAGTLPF
ncbi:unnamed protein product [Phaedon cochleariae]|uniref:Uncharacterized protein n=1 Tax=Phaedon cochleariae TaxID=80249 RepID=A0A9P0DDG0_PHACE|nr:unnamed protein product [Phaedon cochleariae]